MTYPFRQPSKFTVHPPSEERSGVEYKCDICGVVMERYKYYLITTPTAPNPRPTTMKYGTLGFVCSEKCADFYILEHS